MKWGSLENEFGEGRVEINMIKKILIRSSKQDERRRSIKKKRFLFLPQPAFIYLFFLTTRQFLLSDFLNKASVYV